MRILLVGMVESVHAARWVNELTGQNWDVHFFPVREGPIHPLFRDLTIYSAVSERPPDLHPSVKLRRLWPFRQANKLLAAGSNYLFPRWSVRERALALLIRWLKPDIVHSMEFQHAAYLTLEARGLLRRPFPVWIVSNWGSDISLFGRVPEHAGRIREVLSACDFYHCECVRDVALARNFGFRGEVLPIVPVGGGFDLAAMQRLRTPGKTSERRLIALKGYQGWAGRALVGLRAIERCAPQLQGYRVTIYLPSLEVRIRAQMLAEATGIPFEIEGAGWSRDDVLRRHGAARISIGLSISDAISTSLLEAMTMGSFPIQSNTGCGDEWIDDGVTGLLVHPEDPEEIAAAILRALSDDALVDSAAEANAAAVAARLDDRRIRPQVVALYERVAAEARRRRSLSEPATSSWPSGDERDLVN